MSDQQQQQHEHEQYTKEEQLRVMGSLYYNVPYMDMLAQQEEDAIVKAIGHLEPLDVTAMTTAILQIRMYRDHRAVIEYSAVTLHQQQQEQEQGATAGVQNTRMTGRERLHAQRGRR